MTAIFGFLSARPYLAWLLVIAGIVVAGWYWHHATFDAGLDKQRAIDQAQRVKDISEADRKTLLAQQRADKAEAIYAKEHSDSTLYRTQHPDVPIGELCHDIVAAAAVPKATRSHSGTQSGAARAAVGDAVHAPDPGPTYDRPGLLDAFGALLDAQDAVILEYQQRDASPTK